MFSTHHFRFCIIATLMVIGIAPTSRSAPAAEPVTCESEICKSLVNDLLHRSMNLSANPCEDFYQYVCGNYEHYNPLKANEQRVSSFTKRLSEVLHETNDAIKAASVKAKSHTIKYLTELYLGCNATDTLESRGVKPLLDTIDQVLGGWPLLRKNAVSNKRWPALFADLFSHTGLAPIFRITVQYQLNLKAKYLFIAPGGTGMNPNVLLQPTNYEKAIEVYKNYIRQTAIMLGAPDDDQLDEDVNKIVHLETKIAQVLANNPENLIRLGSFVGLNQATHERIDWTETVNSILTTTKSTLKKFSNADKLGAVNLEYLDAATAVLDESTTKDIQNLFGWLIALSFGPATTHKFRHNDAVYREVLTGSINELPNWEFCYDFTNSKLPFALARVYVDSHITSKDRSEAQVLVKEIKNAFRGILKSNTWLDDETQERAIEKLNAIRENVAYPDWLENDADLDNFYEHLKQTNVDKKKFFETAVTLQALTVRQEFDGLHVPLNHTLLWPMTPSTVNAAYMPTENSITIPAAVLKSPFFDESRPFAMNYGAIGAIIGHELTHGFDNTGRQFDLHGERKNWWTQDTLKQFENKAQCFVTQYSEVYDPLAELNINGKQTLGENIADNGGVKEAFAAYRAYEKQHGHSKVLPGLNLNADRLFFVSYAYNWCSVYSVNALKSLIRFNAHTPDKYRVNVVLGDSETFSQVFQCTSKSKMNLAHKCSVW